MRHVNLGERFAAQAVDSPSAARGTAVAKCSGMRALLVLGFLAASGCVQNQPPESQNSVPGENFNQENYSDVPSYGPGSESADGYYGVGNSSDEPERTPADPAVGGHRPY